MSGKNDIKVTEQDFEEAFSKLDTIYSSLVKNQNNFNSICSDLLDGWEGKASDKSNTVLNVMQTKMKKCVDDFNILKQNLTTSFDYLQNSDKSIAEAVDKK